jgi:hypothetical protein
MKNAIQILLRVLVLFCLVLGSYVIYNSRQEKTPEAQLQNAKAVTLKKFLQGYNKPCRIDYFSYTKRYETDVEEIKKMSIPTDENSSFYVTVQFFTDENDPEAPLVAQIRFMDLKSDNMFKEESINL